MAALSPRVQLQLHLQEGLFEELHSKDAHLCSGAPAGKHDVPQKHIRAGMSSWPSDDALRAGAIFLRTSQVAMGTIHVGAMWSYVLKYAAPNVTNVTCW